MSHLNTVKSSKPFDDDLPEARYKSLEEAILKLKEWAKNRVGGFDMVVGTKQRGKSFSGEFNRSPLLFIQSKKEMTFKKIFFPSCGSNLLL